MAGEKIDEAENLNQLLEGRRIEATRTVSIIPTRGEEVDSVLMEASYYWQGSPCKRGAITYIGRTRFVYNTASRTQGVESLVEGEYPISDTVVTTGGATLITHFHQGCR